MKIIRISPAEFLLNNEEGLVLSISMKERTPGGYMGADLVPDNQEVSLEVWEKSAEKLVVETVTEDSVFAQLYYEIHNSAENEKYLMLQDELYAWASTYAYTSRPVPQKFACLFG